MQMAARKVIWENERLRELLLSKGVSAEEISQYVRKQEAELQPVVVERPQTTVAYVDATFANPSDPTSMSCEKAASIIAELRGHIEDKDVVRKELGCADNRSCSVKNIKVFQVMERE